MEKIEDVQRHVLPAYLTILSCNFPPWISFPFDLLFMILLESKFIVEKNFFI